MEEEKKQGFGLWDVAVYVSSVIAVVTFMCHFWWSPLDTISIALWSIAAAFSIFSVYGGIIERSQIQAAGMKKGRVTAAAVIGSLVLLGLALSAIMYMAPLRLAYSGQLG